MCAHYFIRLEEHDNQSISEEVRRRYGPLLPSPPGESISPTQLAPVRCRDRKGGQGYFMMRFGMKAGEHLVINARSESLREKTLFRPLLKERRCLIPASAYTEWKHAGKERIPYQFESPQLPLMFFAGLYRLTPGNRFGDFVILTREAAPDFSEIHPRMPVILNPAVHQDWLNPEKTAEPLLTACLTDLRWSTPQLSFLS